MSDLVVMADEDLAALVAAGSGFPVVGLDDDVQPGGTGVAFEPSDAAAVCWLREGGPARGEVRTIATAGDGLWRRAPWPAADDLFRWPAGERIVVVGDDDPAPIVSRIQAAGADAAPVRALGPRELEAAAVVVFTAPAGDPLPAEAPAVLAAGRVLVTTPRRPDFGLRAAIDHCVGFGVGDLADLAVAAIRHPRAFESMRVYGRLAAERHRASRVFSDLATDLELGL